MRGVGIAGQWELLVSNDEWFLFLWQVMSPEETWIINRTGVGSTSSQVIETNQTLSSLQLENSNLKH